NATQSMSASLRQRSKRCIAANSSRSNAARQNPCSFEHRVGADEKRFRNGQSEHLCSLEVYDQLEFGRQLNRQVGGGRTLEDEIDIRCCAPEQIRRIVAERYQASALREVAIAVNRREPVSGRQLDDELAVSQRHGMRRDNKAAVRLGGECGDGLLDVARISNREGEELYSLRRGSRFGRVEEPHIGSGVRIEHESDSSGAGRNLFE